MVDVLQRLAACYKDSHLMEKYDFSVINLAYLYLNTFNLINLKTLCCLFSKKKEILICKKAAISRTVSGITLDHYVSVIFRCYINKTRKIFLKTIEKMNA